MEVEGVVEELELGAEAINGGSDTMKSNMRKGNMKKQSKEQKRVQRKDEI